jgi:dienelactone hydrolase
MLNAPAEHQRDGELRTTIVEFTWSNSMRESGVAWCFQWDRMSRILTRVATVLVCLCILAVCAVAWIGSERALHPAYHHYDFSLATFPDLHPEVVRVRARGNVVLAGRFFSGEKPALVILACGYGEMQDQMLSIAEFLHKAGFSVLTYSPRARTPSGGEYVTLGALEQDDMVSVVRYAACRKDVDPSRIGVLGISMGGATAILAAAKDQRIRAVVDDSGFSDAPRVIAASFEHFIHLPAFPFAPLTVAVADMRAGIDVAKVRPVDVVKMISPRPLLIIHDARDTVVPVENSLENFAAARQPKELWLPSVAGHVQAHKQVKSEYESRVTHFFEAAMQ